MERGIKGRKVAFGSEMEREKPVEQYEEKKKPCALNWRNGSLGQGGRWV
jgi:hypothetical protein